MTEYRKMKQTKEKRLNDWRDDEEVDERTGCWISIPKAARPTNRQIDMMPWIEERLVPDAFATMAVTVWPGLEF
jgi:hypothetical protein